VGGVLPYKKRKGYSSYISRVKKAVLVPLRVSSLKRSTVRAFVAPFRLLSCKNCNTR